MRYFTFSQNISTMDIPAMTALQQLTSYNQGHISQNSTTTVTIWDKLPTTALEQLQSGRNLPQQLSKSFYDYVILLD